MPRFNLIFGLFFLFSLAGPALGQAEPAPSKDTPLPTAKRSAASPVETAKVSFDHGRAAYQQQRFDDAIAEFSEAIRLAPEQPALWLARSETHLRLSNERFNTSVREAQQAQRDSNGATPKPNFWPAQEELQLALSDAEQAVELTRDLRIPAAQLIGAAIYPNFRYAALGSRSDALRVLVLAFDPGRADEAFAAVQEYLSLETSESKRLAGTMSLAHLMIEADRPERALTLYQQLRSADSDDPDAMLGEAISLIAMGVRASDSTLTQNGLDLLKKFTQTAPEENPFRDSALEVVDFFAGKGTEATGADGASARDMTGKRPLQGSVLNGKAVSLPKPSFPYIAKFARATGSIKVQVMINEDGGVAKIVSVSGHPLLQAAAAEAAKQAKFTPTTVNGIPQTVTGTIIYNFLKQ
jgi:TonB family protein